ncbi:MAG: ribosomal L7Ae/L30e/S12e/Gadd45 family protein, partial [Firmicutes bacterium]|nr:ribosomal L7Ae/L30e/S12e/Gadd45 family protein [Bacillota bacterium]
MNLEILTSARHIVTGMKQTVKAVEGDKAQHVFIAKDADDRIIRLIEVACTAKGVSVTYVD